MFGLGGYAKVWLVLGQTEFMGLEFGIFGELGWVCNLGLEEFKVQPIGFKAAQS